MMLEGIVPFLLVSVVATATPGPAALCVLSAGMSNGLRGYGPGTLGILCADVLYFVLSMAGLGTFILASYHLFLAIKWAGAAYLVWLGLRLWWVALARAGEGVVEAKRTPSRTRWLSGGFMVHAANPKALLYFGSIVPQFLNPKDALLPQIATLGAIHMLTALVVLTTYGVFAARIRVYARNPWFLRSLYGVSGSMLVVTGAGLALLKKSGE